MGAEVVADKRSAGDEPNYAPLTPTAKVKPVHGKRSQGRSNIRVVTVIPVGYNSTTGYF